jgi:hypothetical protein
LADIGPAKPHAPGPGPGKAGIDPRADHVALELGEAPMTWKNIRPAGVVVSIA